MIRWIWQAGSMPSRTLTEDQFVSEVLELAERSFAGVPEGPVTIESIDADERVCWSAYYQRPEALLGLARQLCEERALWGRTPRGTSARPGRG